MLSIRETPTTSLVLDQKSRCQKINNFLFLSTFHISLDYTILLCLQSFSSIALIALLLCFGLGALWEQLKEIISEILVCVFLQLERRTQSHETCSCALLCSQTRSFVFICV